MRRTQPVTIDAAGRDKGKVFLLTEMAAAVAEKWAARAFLALIESGVNIPDDIAKAGVAGLASKEGMASIGAALLNGLGKIRWDLLEPLLDEMMTCVRMIPDPQKNPDFSRALADGDIEEVATLLKLRGELLKLHTSFFTGAGPSPSEAPVASKEAPISRMSRRG